MTSEESIARILPDFYRKHHLAYGRHCVGALAPSARDIAKRNTPAESATERCERSLTPNASFKRATQVEDATLPGFRGEVGPHGLSDQIIDTDRELKTKNLGQL